MQIDYISIGEECSPCFLLKACNLRTVAYPFDWNVVPVNTMIQCVDEDFKNFHKGLTLNDTGQRVIDSYGIQFPHDYPVYNVNPQPKDSFIDPDGVFYIEKKIVSNFHEFTDKVYEKYDRRIKRFYDALNSRRNTVLIYSGHKDNIERILIFFINKFNKSNIALLYINHGEWESSLCYLNEEPITVKFTEEAAEGRYKDMKVLLDLAIKRFSHNALQ